MLIWFTLYVAVSVIGGSYYWFGGDPQEKRETFPWFLALAALLFMCLVLFGFHVSIGIGALLAVLVAAVTTRNILSITFCGQCARIVDRGLLRKRANFCPECGAPLDDGSADQLPGREKR